MSTFSGADANALLPGDRPGRSETLQDDATSVYPAHNRRFPYTPRVHIEFNLTEGDLRAFVEHSLDHNRLSRTLAAESRRTQHASIIMLLVIGIAHTLSCNLLTS